MKDKNKENIAANTAVNLDTLRELIVSCKKAYGEDTAFYLEDRNVTYNMFYGDITAIGTGIYETLKLEKSNIGIIAENSYITDVAYFSTICGNNIATSIDIDSSVEEIVEIAKKTNMEAIIFSKTYEEKIKKVKECMKRSKLKHYIITLDTSDEFVSTGELSREGITILRSGNNEYMRVMQTSEDIRVIITKGVDVSYLSSKSILSSLKSILEIVDVDCRDKYLSALEVSNSSEMIVSRFVQIARGASVTYIKGQRVVENLKKFSPSVMLIQNVQLKKIYNALEEYIERNKKQSKVSRVIKATDKMGSVGLKLKKKIFKDILEQVGGNLRLLIIDAKNMDIDKVKYINDLGISVLSGYMPRGVLPIVSLNNAIDGTGSYPIKGAEVKIEMPNLDGIGQILVKGDITYCEKDYIRTGDVGYIDGSGNIHVVGNVKNEIVLDCGEKIYPEHIENKLVKIRNVEDALICQRVINGKTSIFAKIKLKNKYCIENVEEKGLAIYGAKINKKLSKKQRKLNKDKPSCIDRTIKKDNRRYIKDEIDKLNNVLSRYNKISDFEIVENI
ncbi:MAG: AMP-binding protein [Clostridia bacterium]